MNYFSRNNLLIWVIIVLLILILSALGTILYNMNKFRHERPEFRPELFKKEAFLKDKLNLDDNQIKKFKEINEKQDEFRENIMEKMRYHRHKIDSILMLDNPDTAKITVYMKEITALQTKMIKEHINTYLAMKNVCNPEQQKKLSDLFKRMLLDRQAKRHMRPEKDGE